MSCEAAPRSSNNSYVIHGPDPLRADVLSFWRQRYHIRLGANCAIPLQKVEHLQLSLELDSIVHKHLALSNLVQMLKDGEKFPHLLVHTTVHMINKGFIT